tara:strand:- start:2634 stop:3140 length:507 start_codon:yes stop_codon:yes gene_type:complete
MIIGLTGHTRGLGFEICKHFNVQKTYSKSNGYDINDVDQIVSKSLDCDVFINNAYDFKNGFAQTELLLEFYRKGFKGLVINISSSIETLVRDDLRVYDIHKRSLIDCSKQLYYLGFKSSAISPGAIDIGLGKNFQGNKLAVESVINSINFVIQENGRVQHLILTGKFS